MLVLIAKDETILAKRTKRMIQIELNLASIVSSVTSTLTIEKLSKGG